MSGRQYLRGELRIGLISDFVRRFDGSLPVRLAGTEIWKKLYAGTSMSQTLWFLFSFIAVLALIGSPPGWFADRRQSPRPNTNRGGCRGWL